MKKPNQSSKKAPAAPKRPARDARDARDDNPCESLSLETVEQYVKYKAFDVIGNGNYRRYVNNCKEKNEPWALEITNAVAQMTALTKSIQSLVNDLQKNNKTGLHTLCQTVIENNTPPIDQHTVIAECSVSGKQKCQCIVLKCKGRGAPCIMVQSRFGHFVLMLWTVFKLDLVIKTMTRDFIESVEKDTEKSIREICEMFTHDSATVTNIATAILHAIQHVHASLYSALLA